jgi:hypothetical protein
MVSSIRTSMISTYFILFLAPSRVAQWVDDLVSIH